MVNKNIDKISDLTLSMLAYSKDRKPDYKLSSINQLIQDIMELVLGRAEKENIELIAHLDTEIEEFELDPKAIFDSL